MARPTKQADTVDTSDLFSLPQIQTPAPPPATRAAPLGEHTKKPPPPTVTCEPTNAHSRSEAVLAKIPPPLKGSCTLRFVPDDEQSLYWDAFDYFISEAKPQSAAEIILLRDRAMLDAEIIVLHRKIAALTATCRRDALVYWVRCVAPILFKRVAPDGRIEPALVQKVLLSDKDLTWVPMFLPERVREPNELDDQMGGAVAELISSFKSHEDGLAWLSKYMPEAEMVVTTTAAKFELEKYADVINGLEKRIAAAERRRNAATAEFAKHRERNLRFIDRLIKVSRSYGERNGEREPRRIANDGD